MLVEETCEGNFLWMQKHQNFAGTSFHEFIKKLQTRDSFFPEGFFINFVFFTSRVFRNIFKLFVLNAAFLYPLKTSEDLKVFWCFQGVEKGCIGKEWVLSTAKATDQAFSYIQNTSLSSTSEIIIPSLTEREHTQVWSIVK